MSDSEKRGGDLFIVDNSDSEWKVQRYLHDWADLSSALDIATGYFEIGSLLALEGQWQKLEKIRILMGDEVSRRTKQALLAGIERAEAKLDESIESEKEKNDFLAGVPGIVEALQKRQIECRIYTKEKFHAKAYITHAKQAVVGSAALVGSSNFTVPGITNNVELNIQIRREVETLQQWYEDHWNDAKDVTPEILRIIERHTAQHPPFLVYAKALDEFFRGHEMTASEWEEGGGSKVYPRLDQYQKEGYRALMKIARQYRGAFLCDGVGLGKTFIGLMLIERLVVHDRQRVVLLVPKAARASVWERTLHEILPDIGHVFSNLVILNHTDLLRGREYPAKLAAIKEKADAIIIDEAHHFRNPGLVEKSRYWKLYDIARNKAVFMLTATPVNNRLIDLQHMIQIFSRRDVPHYFGAAPLGIHSLPGHFRRMEKALEELVAAKESANGGVETNQVEAEKVLANDALFHALVVQRSRAYVKKSQEQSQATKTIFPERKPPHVADYSIKKTYGRLLTILEAAFSKEKPLFSLAIYYPLFYYKGPDSSIDPLTKGRQQQVVGLIRTQFLKRFESSARAFEMSCQTLLLKLLAWASKHSTEPAEVKRLERWKAQHQELLDYVKEQQASIAGEIEDAEEDLITDEMLEAVEELKHEEYKLDEILSETYLDLDQVVEFLRELKKFKASNDDKLRELTRLLKSDPVLKEHKVLIFTEYMDTARYLLKQLKAAGMKGVDEVDSARAGADDRGEIITRFSPYYNASSSAELAAQGLSETRILISTDVLSEGLNLQDATRLINYDLHWNPVRLMQRIGRVDRRLNPDDEERILHDHPDQKDIRRHVEYWNFLPPDELDDLLKLYEKVSHKTLRISKTFGIEGKKLLKPDDDFEALREFNQTYEGTTNPIESMHLEYQKLLQDHPDLRGRLAALPGRVFSGKRHPSPGAKAVFFCYALPAPPASLAEEAEVDAAAWTEEAGRTRWYLYDLGRDRVVEEPSEIIDVIRSRPDTPRHHEIAENTLSEIRSKIDKHIKNSYLKQVQAPIGVKPILKAWMELS